MGSIGRRQLAQLVRAWLDDSEVPVLVSTKAQADGRQSRHCQTRVLSANQGQRTLRVCSIPGMDEKTDSCSAYVQGRRSLL